MVSQTSCPSPFLSHWTLDPAITFLNHGSFGACPTPVLAEQQKWRDRLERQPLQFLGKELEPLLDQAREALGEFVGADGADLAFVPNATTGVNTVLRSLVFAPGDQLLTTNQEYNACRNALDYLAERDGLQVVVAHVPFPVVDGSAIVEAILPKISAHTKLVLLDHVVSQTGLIFPVAEIISHLKDLGIASLIDGAHAPGMIPLNLRALGATFYTGNCHKWLCSPKGAAFLYVQRDRQSDIHPLTISHGRNDPRTTRSRFRLEFDWMGTGDPSAYLSVPAAIRFMGSLLPGGWPALMQHNHELAIAARAHLCNALQVPPPCPDELLGSMAVISLPDGPWLELHDRLLDCYGIEVPIVPFPAVPHRLVRISAQIYNQRSQYEFLADALMTVLSEAG